MSYIDQNLIKGENVIYRTKLHWIIFVQPVFFLIISFIFLSFATTVDFAGMFGAILLILSIIDLIVVIINYITSEFGITDKRVLVKYGVIKRKSVETLIKKVEGISVDQSIFGRILGYGIITISGTGGTKEPFKRIAKPMEFRKQLNELIDKNS